MALPSQSARRLEDHSMGDLPNAVIKRLLAKHGGGLRISGSAIEKAAEATEDFIARLAREAQAAAVADKRKTVMDHDIVKARSKLDAPGL
jgi:histone H3/H4